MNVLSVLAAEDSSGGGGAALIQLLVLLMIPVAMYFLMIRPQRRRMKAQQAMQTSIGLGDEVVTTSGVYGFITGVEDDKFWLEIDDDVQIRIAKAAIQGKITPSDAPEPSRPVDAPADVTTDADATSDPA
jgi:preprotein translocase subunit YajC